MSSQKTSKQIPLHRRIIIAKLELAKLLTDASADVRSYRDGVILHELQYDPDTQSMLDLYKKGGDAQSAVQKA